LEGLSEIFGAKAKSLACNNKTWMRCSGSKGLLGDFDGPATGIPARAKAVILRLGKSWMSDRTKNVLILVVVVCLAIVVADLRIGISPD